MCINSNKYTVSIVDIVNLLVLIIYKNVYCTLSTTNFNRAPSRGRLCGDGGIRTVGDACPYDTWDEGLRGVEDAAPYDVGEPRKLRRFCADFVHIQLTRGLTVLCVRRPES